MQEQLALIEFSPELRHDMRQFLIQWIAIEDEEARLRQEKADLRDAYKDKLFLRAVLTAVKRVRAQRALEDHPKEPMSRQYQVQYEELVETFLEERLTNATAITRAAEALARPLNGTTVTLHMDGREE